MSIEQKLINCDVSRWRTRLAVVFDWYDGPRHGICALENPQCEFVFYLLDEQTNPDGLDHRLFRISEIPDGSVDNLVSQVAVLGSPFASVWTPIWRFPTEQKRAEADSDVEKLLDSGRQTNIIFLSQDLISYLGRWNAEVIPNERVDWFAALKIPPV